MKYVLALALILQVGCKTDGSERPAAKGDMELQASSMLPAMRAHLDSMESGGRLTPASMPQHRLQVRNFVRATETDMQRLGMHSDPAYEALADSVLKGLERLAGAGSSGVERLAAEHLDRVRRLASVYEHMVTATK